MNADAIYYLLAFSCRIAAFLAGLSLFPGAAVPLSVRAGLGFAILVFFLPLIPGLDSLSAFGVLQFLAEDGPAAAAKPLFAVLLVELSLGLFLAVAAGAAGYFAVSAAAWIAAAFGSPIAAVGRSQEAGARRSSSLQTALLLLLLYCVCSSPSFPWLWAFFGRSLLRFPYAPGMAAHAQFTAGPAVFAFLGETARLALAVALLASLPIFVAALITDLLMLPCRRYFPAVFDSAMLSSARAPALIFVLGLMLFSYSRDLSAYIAASLSLTRSAQVLDILQGRSPAALPAGHQNEQKSTGEQK